MSELSVERLFSDPPLFPGLPQEARFSPDGAWVTYLRLADDDRERLDLWRFDLAAGRHERWVDARGLADAGTGAITAAEKAERERRRQFARGITDYRFSPDGCRLLLPAAGSAFVMDVPGGELRPVTPPGTRQTDIRFSPDGTRLSYVRDGNLYCKDLTSGMETALTADGNGVVCNGIADFIAQEEMHRFEGYWWSPDSRLIAFTRVDTSPVPESQRFEIQADTVTVVPQRYPYAGASNVDVRLLVIDLETGAVREIPYRLEQEDYLARVSWLGNRLAVQRQSRDQRTLDLYLFDPRSGDRACLLTESSDTWINLHDNFLPVEPDAPGGDAARQPGGTAESRRFLWTSERTGNSHVYLWDDGELHPLTRGGGRVNRVLWSDGRRVLVSGWFDLPTEQHLFHLDLSGEGAPQCLTDQPGWHELTVSRDGRRVLDRWSNLAMPGRLDVMALSDASAPRRRLIEDTVVAGHPYYPYLDSHVTPELGVLTAEDGQTLHYRLTAPSGPEPDGGYPVVVSVYGGPGVQRVRNEWSPLLLQLFSDRGYGVLELDNRGSSNRERRFEAPIYRHLGSAEVRDQLVGARFLATLSWVNPQRIGVFGHSYGGYMTLMCMMQAPETFKAGVAVAPVTDWHLYDTHYTERYLGTPALNPAAYDASDVLRCSDGLAGSLLIVHGMADDNVLFTHTTKLIRRLQADNRPFEMMAYPGSKHALQERDVSIHRFNLLFDFFGRHL